VIHVVLASDRNLVRQAGIAALSARRQTAAPLRVTFLTPAQDASSGLWDTVTRALAAERTECEVRPVQIALPELQLAAHLTPVTYYRLLLPRLLPERDERVIYLDCDVLVNTDLGELWAHELGDRSLAGVPDPKFQEWTRLGIDPSDGYFNAGVLLLDLASIRRERLFEAALRFSQEHPEALTWSDQCALNRVFTKRWSPLDKRWNYQHAAMVQDASESGLARAVEIASTSVVHFNNYNRPWLPESWHPLQRRYFAVVASRPELDPRVSPTLSQRVTRLKRMVKWRVDRLRRASP